MPIKKGGNYVIILKKAVMICVWFISTFNCNHQFK